MKLNVIAHKNLPTKMPFTLTVLAYLVLDKFNNPAWAVGAVCAVLVVLWIISFVTFYHEQETDIMKDK